MYLLLFAAIFPVALLCYYIYKKDINHEPNQLLGKLFSLGFLSAIPVVIVEVFLGSFFPTEGVRDFLPLFLNVFVSVALVEEGFKWIITKNIGYNSKEFDEIYDIIVYSVFASLGFACIENILFVFQNGLGNAIMRALLSIPGHTCFAVMMGYFFAMAKTNSVNRNSSLSRRNMILSLLVPALLHTIYDTLLFYANANEAFSFLLLFLVFDITMVVFCFKTVNRISVIQQNLDTKFSNQSITNSNESSQSMHSNGIHFCPICGKPTKGYNFCIHCGFKLQ